MTATTTLAAIRELPGLEAYLDELEERLHEVVSAHGGLVSTVGEEALSAGGKRLPSRPASRSRCAWPAPPKSSACL